MGSFDVGCGISNLGIQTGDKIGFVILGENEEVKEYNDGIGQSRYHMSTDLFKPFAPPVFGTYGDYGRVENIASSDTVTLLEDIFARPIKVVTDCIGDNRTVYNRYSIIRKHYIDEDVMSILKNGKGITNSLSLVKAKFLKEFQIITDNSEEQEYLFHNHVFFRMVEPTGAEPIPTWKVTNVNTKVSIKQEPYEDIEGFLDRFSSSTDLYPGVVSSEYNVVKRLQTLSGMYILEDVFKGMVHHLNNGPTAFLTKYDQKGFYERMTKLSQAIKYGHNCEDGSLFIYMGSRLMRFFEQSTSFPAEYLDKLSIYDSSEFAYVYDKSIQLNKLIVLQELIHIMGSVNRMFQPSFCGPQNGDDEAAQALNKLTKKIVKKRLKEQEDG